MIVLDEISQLLVVGGWIVGINLLVEKEIIIVQWIMMNAWWGGFEDGQNKANIQRSTSEFTQLRHK